MINVNCSILDCIAADERLREILVLRGGAALRLFYGGLRQAADLDFLVLNLDELAGAAQGAESAKNRLNALLNQRVLRLVPEPQWATWLAVIQIDLAPCHIATECRFQKVPGFNPIDHPGTVKVCTLEDIVADKIVALFNNVRAERRREQDLFDVASIVGSRAAALNPRRVVELGHMKARTPRVKFARESLTKEVQSRLAVNYDALRESTGHAFIPYKTAIAQVEAFLCAIER